jgi:hypothetical protein
METKKIKKIGVIYHFPCYDGSYSALNLYLYYTYLKKHNEVYFYPSNSNNRIAEGFTEDYDKVYILDKGLNDDDYKYLIGRKDVDSQKVVVIDHHSSAIEVYNKEFKDQFSGLKKIEIIFDDSNTKSAAGMTYDYFYKKASKKFLETEVTVVFTEKWKKVRNG